MKYLINFTEAGQRINTYPIDILMTDERKKELVGAGFIETSEEDWEYYIGANGSGDNGTGYIRDPETGKPVSAPAYVPTKEEKADALFNECQADIKEIDAQIMNAIILKDTKLEKELRQERDERITKYQKELDDLGGEE